MRRRTVTRGILLPLLIGGRMIVALVGVVFTLWNICGPPLGKAKEAKEAKEAQGEAKAGGELFEFFSKAVQKIAKAFYLVFKAMLGRIFDIAKIGAYFDIAIYFRQATRGDVQVLKKLPVGRMACPTFGNVGGNRDSGPAHLTNKAKFFLGRKESCLAIDGFDQFSGLFPNHEILESLRHKFILASFQVTAQVASPIFASPLPFDSLRSLRVVSEVEPEGGRSQSSRHLRRPRR